MKKTVCLTLLLAIVQVVAFAQADSCFTLLIRPTLLGAPYYGILPITVTNQTQGTSFVMNDSLLQNCNPTGVEDFDARGFSLSASYPNPSEGKAHVTLTTSHDGNVVLQLYDVQGRLKASSKVALERGTHTVEVSLSGRGLHVLRATSHGQNVYTKIVNLASPGGSDAIRISASGSVPQYSKGVQTQQNVRVGDAIRMTNTFLFSHDLDSVRNGLFVASVRETKYTRFFHTDHSDTLLWNENSLKNKIVAIPLPYKSAFLDDYNANHLIWQYIDFQDSTFIVEYNLSCPLVDIPNNPPQYYSFENGCIELEMNDCMQVWPLQPDVYKYRISQSPYADDPLMFQGQLDVFTLDGVFIMTRYLYIRPADFPNAFYMQKGHMGDGWSDEIPPTIPLFIVRQ